MRRKRHPPHFIHHAAHALRRRAQLSLAALRVEQLEGGPGEGEEGEGEEHVLLFRKRTTRRVRPRRGSAPADAFKRRSAPHSRSAQNTHHSIGRAEAMLKARENFGSGRGLREKWVQVRVSHSSLSCRVMRAVRAVQKCVVDAYKHTGASDGPLESSVLRTKPEARKGTSQESPLMFHAQSFHWSVVPREYVA